MTNTSTRSVVGVFSEATVAERVVDDLVSNGFDRSQIDIQSNDSYAAETARGNTGLSGAAHDSSGGGIGGFFRRMFGDDTRNDYSAYSNAVTRGSSVVCVTTDEMRADYAVDIMERHGAMDIDESGSTTGYQSTVDRSATTMTHDNLIDRRDHSDNTPQSIPVVQEELAVGKQTVRRGGVRVFNRVVEQPVQEDVVLREEHVRIDRHAVDRPATEADLRATEVIEVTEMAEEPVVAKRSRVVEEVVIDKDTTERHQTISDTVRRTEVEVEQMDGSTDKRDDFRR